MATDQLNLEIVGPYLEAHIDGFKGLQSAKKFEGGQSNPTFLLGADSGQYVLRRQPPGELLKSAHAVDREYRVINALRNSDVPVARADHLCEDRDVIGSMFYVMSYEKGRIFWDPGLPDLDNPQRTAIFDEMSRIMMWISMLWDLAISAGLAIILNGNLAAGPSSIKHRKQRRSSRWIGLCNGCLIICPMMMVRSA